MNEPGQRSEDGAVRARRPALMPPRPLLRMVVLGALLLVCLLAALAVQFYRVAWQDAWQEVHDKHRVLAVSLANGVAAYARDRRAALARVAADLSHLDVSDADALAPLLGSARRNVDGIRSVTLLDSGGRLLAGAQPLAQPTIDAVAAGSAFISALNSGSPHQAGIDASPLDGVPSLLGGWPVRDAHGRVVAVLVGELSVAPVEALRREIRFGEGGHALVVDRRGRVLAHPSPAWMREMRDLSGLDVVQAALAGGSGVAEFYAPFAEAHMVAGYATVPGVGWGVIVPQPKQEIATRVRALLFNQLAWLALLLVLVVVAAYLVAAWISRPLDDLTDGLGGGGRRKGGPPR